MAPLSPLNRSAAARFSLPNPVHRSNHPAEYLHLPPIKQYLWPHMKTTIDLPDAILQRTKIAAARRRTTIKNLVIEGLETVLREDAPEPPPSDALARLRHGYHLGGKPLTRDEAHGS